MQHHLQHAVILDCDPGIDDALALMLAAGSPELRLVGITTVAGNRPVEVTSLNARRIMDLAGRQQVPVHAGAACPFGHAQPRCNLVHGEDGLGGVDLGPPSALSPGHAATQLVQWLRDSPAQTLTLVAVGPLTNLALAESLSPGVLQRAHRVLIMGGALRCAGNVTPAAEFNFYADPVAAQMVLAAQADTVLFPLDVTRQAAMPAAWIDSLADLPSRCGQAAARMLRAYASVDPLLHDACPVACLLDDSLFTAEPCHVDVDWRPGPTEGHVSAWFAPRQPNRVAFPATAMTRVRGPALLDLVRERIGALP